MRTNRDLPIACPDQPGKAGLPCLDLRFCRLLDAAQWSALPPAVRARFSKRLAGGQTTVYSGRVTACDISRAGMILAQAARIIGGPLPLSRDTGMPSVVTVTEDICSGGQIWTRLYARRSGFPQVVNSSKRFCGPTGLEEHVGGGIAMTLALRVEGETLLFESRRYFLQLGRLKFHLPRWLSPGRLTVGHHPISARRFAFTLDLVHPWFGRLIHQRAEFEEVHT